MTLVGKELRFFVIYIIKRLYIQGYNLLKSFLLIFFSSSGGWGFGSRGWRGGLRSRGWGLVSAGFLSKS